jgi:probable F420-dependent oxidoreductase
MDTGVFLPNLGPAAGGRSIREVAERAEQLGFDSVWVTERIFQPVEPTAPFPGDPSGAYPTAYERVLDPVASLAVAAASTERIRLGTSVLVAPYYHPLLLARSLTTLDVVAQGRLEVGLGVGWHVDEFDALGVDFGTRGRRMEEILALLHALWSENPVSFDGAYFQLRAASVLPKPLQQPRPPILIGAFSQPALERAARLADGIQPPGTLPPAELEWLVDSYRGMVAAAGRDPGLARIVLRAQVDIRRGPLGDGRVPFSGSPEQIVDDIAAARRLGISDLICDSVYFARSLDELLESLEQIRRFVDASE